MWVGFHQRAEPLAEVTQVCEHVKSLEIVVLRVRGVVRHLESEI